MRVICIRSFDDVRNDRRMCYGDEILPEEGKIYHVRKIIPPEPRGIRQMNAYLLEEIVNVPRLYHPDTMREIMFGENRFRRITDISALTRLTKVRELEDVE
jgi:hypothetical protein